MFRRIDCEGRIQVEVWTIFLASYRASEGSDGMSGGERLWRVSTISGPTSQTREGRRSFRRIWGKVNN